MRTRTRSRMMRMKGIKEEMTKRRSHLEVLVALMVVIILGVCHLEEEGLRGEEEEEG